MRLLVPGDRRPGVGRMNPELIPAAYTKGFTVEPICRSPCVARLYLLWR